MDDIIQVIPFKNTLKSKSIVLKVLFRCQNPSLLGSDLLSSMNAIPAITSIIIIMIIIIILNEHACWKGIKDDIHVEWTRQCKTLCNGPCVCLRQTSKYHNQASFVYEQNYLHLHSFLMVFFLKQLSWEFNYVKLRQIRFSKRYLVVKLLVWRKHAWWLFWVDRIERRKTVIPAVKRRGGDGRRTAPYSYLYLI